MDDLSEVVSALEARVERLERGRSLPGEPAAGAPPETPGLDLWAVERLDDSVVFAGDVAVGEGRVTYQWERPLAFLRDHDWEDSLERLAAVAHPIRGRILRRLLDGPATANDLVDDGIASSHGTAYHHLNALHAGGWIGKGASGTHTIRPSRVVPLLTLIACGEDH